MTTATLTSAHLLAQAYEMLVPSGLWTKERWLAVSDETDPQSPVYTMCSVGALLFADHLSAGADLFRSYDFDNDVHTVTSDWDQYDHEDDAGEAAGSQVEVLFENDDVFGAAVSYLATVIKAEGYEPFNPNNDISWVVQWNDEASTTLDDVQRVFQAAINLAEAAN